jgi:hypothetical protein
VGSNIVCIAAINASTETLSEDPNLGLALVVSATHLQRSHNIADLEHGFDAESENPHGSPHHHAHHVVVFQEGSPNARDLAVLENENILLFPAR